MTKITLIFLLISTVIIIYITRYFINLEIYKKALDNPTYFYMVPRLYQLFYILNDLKDYNEFAFNNAIDLANNFCKILLLLEMDPNVEYIKKKALLERLDFYRLETLAELTSLFITVPPEKVLLNKLKGTIGLINRELLFDTEEAYKLVGLDYSMKSKVVPANSIEANTFHFYLN